MRRFTKVINKLSDIVATIIGHLLVVLWVGVLIAVPLAAIAGCFWIILFIFGV